MTEPACPTLPSTPLAPPQPRWLRRFFVSAGLVCLVFGSLLACLIYYRANEAERGLQAAIDEAEHLDPGWQWDELSTRWADVPDAENSALVAQACRRVLPAAWTVLTPNQHPASQLNASLTGTLCEQLNTLGPALDLARRLSEMPRGRHRLAWTPDFVMTPMTDHQNLRSIASLLSCDAALLAQAGQADAALASARGALNAGRSTGEEGTVISFLIRIACAALAQGSMERTLAQGQPSDAALQSTQALLEDEVTQPRLLTALRCERAGMNQAMEAIRAGNINLSQLLGTPTSADQFLVALGSNELRRNQAVLLRFMTQFVELARLPAEQQSSRAQKLENDLRQLGMTYPIARDMLIGITKISAASNRSQAQLRTAIVALAAERYHIANGRWPEKLADLCPTFLAAVPTDPFDGQPLRLRRLAEGIVIYSVGPDGIDNSGTLNRQKPVQPGTDVGFQLWDIDQRRQPPEKKDE